MKVDRITTEYKHNNEQSIREHHYFYARVYRAVSKHHPHGEVVKEAKEGLDDCYRDYKLIGSSPSSIIGAVTKAFNELGGILSGNNNH